MKKIVGRGGGCGKMLREVRECEKIWEKVRCGGC